MATTIRVAEGDLTESDATVLVNASNTNAVLGTGVSGAMRRACGAGYQKQILAELQAQRGGPMEPGEVLITGAGTHPAARWVAHVAVMDYREGFTAQSYPDEATVERGCRALWDRLEALGEQLSVAMVALGAGTGNLGLRRSVEIACTTLEEHLARTQASAIAQVTFFGYTLPEFLVTLEVVREHFEVPLDCIPEELRHGPG